MVKGTLRVIAGTAGGLRLVTPRGHATRPTADRVRESVFAALGDAVVDAEVLDLYAGSGALAIEALSRGARRAVLVDRDRRATQACRQNLASTRLSARARVQTSSVATFLRTGPPAEAPFDLVFIDPPYGTGEAAARGVLDVLARPGWLSPGAVIVVETGTAAIDAGLSDWRTRWERRYGDTLVRVLDRAA